MPFSLGPLVVSRATKRGTCLVVNAKPEYMTKKKASTRGGEPANLKGQGGFKETKQRHGRGFGPQQWAAQLNSRASSPAKVVQNDSPRPILPQCKELHRRFSYGMGIDTGVTNSKQHGFICPAPKLGSIPFQIEKSYFLIRRIFY